LSGGTPYRPRFSRSASIFSARFLVREPSVAASSASLYDPIRPASVGAKSAPRNCRVRHSASKSRSKHVRVTSAETVEYECNAAIGDQGSKTHHAHDLLRRAAECHGTRAMQGSHPKHK